MKRNLLRKRKGWVPVNFLHCQSRLAPKTTVASIWRHIPCDFRLPISNMAASRLEINFIRLLSRCEAIASEKRQETEWRLEKVNWMKRLCCNSYSCRWFLTLICVLEFFQPVWEPRRPAGGSSTRAQSRLLHISLLLFHLH